MMMNMHKAALPPYYKGVDTLSRSLNNCLYVLVGSAGAPPCRTGVPRPELFYLIQLGHCILFNIDKWSTTFNYSKTRDTSLFLIILITAILVFPSVCLR